MKSYSVSIDFFLIIIWLILHNHEFFGIIITFFHNYDVIMQKYSGVYLKKSRIWHLILKTNQGLCQIIMLKKTGVKQKNKYLCKTVNWYHSFWYLYFYIINNLFGSEKIKKWLSILYILKIIVAVYMYNNPNFRFHFDCYLIERKRSEIALFIIKILSAYKRIIPRQISKIYKSKLR